MSNPVEFDLCFKQNLTDRVAVILDGSESSWEAVRNATEKLINSLSVSLEGLWFAGNPKPYSIITPRDFSENIPGWFHNNRNRVTLINPILERLEQSGFTGMIALVTAGSPIDLDDWLDTGILERTVLVRIGSEPLTDYARELEASVAGHVLAAEFQNQVRGIRITGQGFAPLCWESKGNVRIEQEFEDGVFSLNVYPDTTQLELHLKALGTEQPKMTIKRDRGSAFEYLGVPESSWFRKPDWRDMTPDHLAVFASLRKNERFFCIQCDRLHEPDTFICPQGDLILKGIPADEVVLFSDKSYMTLSGWKGWPLCGATSLITVDGVQYRFIKGAWNKWGNQLCSAENVDDAMWAIYHRV